MTAIQAVLLEAASENTHGWPTEGVNERPDWDSDRQKQNEQCDQPCHRNLPSRTCQLRS
jgi:hypothetical protein